MKKILLSVIMMMSCYISMAETNVNSSDLKGVWQQDDIEESTRRTWTFTDKEVNELAQIDVNDPEYDVTTTYSFYLCSSYQSEFDVAKVGKSSNGSRLIMLCKKWMHQYKILSLTKDTLTVSFWVPDSGQRAAGEVTLVFKRVK